MTNGSVQWFFDKLIENGIIIVNRTTYQVKYKHEILLEQAKEMYKDEMEAAIIKQCAEQSTSEASKYAEGYSEGYKRALELVEWKIKTIKENEQR